MESFFVFILMAVSVHYVTAEEKVRLCSTSEIGNSSSVSCQTDDDCSSQEICCQHQGSTLCVVPVTPNYRATLYILGLPVVANESTHLTSYIEATLGETGTVEDLQIKRLGRCVQMFLSLHTGDEKGVDDILMTMESSPVHIDHFSGGPFEVTSYTNQSTCKHDTAAAVPNFKAVLTVIGVPTSITPDIIESKMMDLVQQSGRGWNTASRKIGGCLEVHLEALLTPEEEEKVSQSLDAMEDEGLTVTDDGASLKVVSSKEDAAVCPTLKVNDTVHWLIPNYQAQFYIVNVVGVVTFDQLKQAILEEIRSFGSGWQIRNQTVGGCMEVYLAGVVEEEKEEDLSMVLDNMEEKGLTVTSAGRVFKMTSRNDEMADVCKKTNLPKYDCSSLGCGNGTCVNSTTGPMCRCPEGVHGDHCQHSAGAHQDVTCGPMEMSFSIATSRLEFEPENVTLSDPRCHVRVMDGRLTGKTSLNTCGTTFRLTNDSLIFSNFLLFPPPPPSPPSSSSSSSDLSSNASNSVERVIPIECHYQRGSELQLSYLPMVRHVLFTETGVGQFQFRIEQFRDASFASRVADSAYPLRVSSGQTLFLQLSLGQSVLEEVEGGFGMEVDTCVASHSPSMMAAHNVSSQELIRDSCPAMTDVQLIDDSQSQNATQNSTEPHHRFRFSFQPVVLSESSESGEMSSVSLVYIHCRVRLCPERSCASPAECAPPAPSSSQGGSRVKREVSGLGSRQRRFDERHLSTGPLVVSVHTDDTPTLKNSADSRLVAALGAVAGMATLISVAVMVAWALTRRVEGRYDVAAKQL